MTFSNIGIIGWKDKNADLRFAMEIFARVASVYKQVHFYVLESLQGLVQKPIRVASEAKIKKCDLLIAVGGDGTVLSAARLALGSGMPILGVNAGHVGFLAETKVEDLESTLELVFRGAFSLRRRMMLDALIYRNREIHSRETFLNEVHILPQAPERMVNVNVEYNGRPLTEYWADSLLVSTPTGSTAYNLAAGGPIIYPSTSAYVLTPVAPSSLSVRPLVFPADAHCRIFAANHAPLALIFDGRIAKTLAPGEWVSLFQSKAVTSFIRLSQSGFVDALREKLGWTGKPKLG